MTLARNLVESIGRAIFPHVCEFCARELATPAQSYICDNCRAKPHAITPIQAPFCKVCGLEYGGQITTEFVCWNCSDLEVRFESARAAVHYKALVKEVVHRYKYNRQEWFEPFLAQLLIEAALPELKHLRIDLITPIPLHPAKLRQRGFNQAARLAQRLSMASGIRHEPFLLERVKATDSQAMLDRDDRLANVKGAFAFKPRERLAGQTILLIDDVLTTGVTASACAKELRRHGAGPVHVWTVARGGLT